MSAIRISQLITRRLTVRGGSFGTGSRAPKGLLHDIPKVF